jgi:hypothetical protein
LIPCSYDFEFRLGPSAQFCRALYLCCGALYLTALAPMLRSFVPHGPSAHAEKLCTFHGPSALCCRALYSALAPRLRSFVPFVALAPYAAELCTREVELRAKRLPMRPACSVLLAAPDFPPASLLLEYGLWLGQDCMRARDPRKPLDSAHSGQMSARLNGELAAAGDDQMRRAGTMGRSGPSVRIGEVRARLGVSLRSKPPSRPTPPRSAARLGARVHACAERACTAPCHVCTHSACVSTS